MSQKQMFAVASLMLIGLTVMVAAPQQHSQERVPHKHAAVMPIEAVQDFLGLTDAQVARWQDLQAVRLSMKQEQFSQVRELEEQLQEELKSNTPSAGDVGTLVIRLHESRQAQGEAHQAFTEQVRAILTPDQLQKLEQVEESLRARKETDALIKTGFLAPPPPPPPPPHAPVPHAPMAPPPPPPPPVHGE